MVMQLLLFFAALGSVIFVSYWTGRRHGEADRHALLDELDFQQYLLDGYASGKGPSQNHPKFRLIKGDL
jgi:hypothetical protein